MKLILDEWIVREVIDTLYMARTTFLGITGLDSPQEVAKKSANETAITRRISKAIDIIQQSEQSSLPADLEEASDGYAEKHGFRVPYDGSDNFYDDVDVKASKEGFIAGASWQSEQMMKEAVEAHVSTNGMGNKYLFPNYNDDFKDIDDGDKVRIIVIKKD